MREGYRMARPISDRPGCISHLYKHLILHIIVYESIIIKGLVIGYMMKLRYTLLTRPIPDRPGCYVLSTYILY